MDTKKILTEKELEDITGGIGFEREEDANNFAAEYPPGTRVGLMGLIRPGEDATGVVLKNDVRCAPRLDGSIEFYYMNMIVRLDENCRFSPNPKNADITLLSAEKLRKL